MIEKMKRTPKAKFGWRVFLESENTLVDEICNLNKFLQCSTVFTHCGQHLYHKPTFLMYTDCVETQVWIDKLLCLGEG